VTSRWWPTSAALVGFVALATACGGASKVTQEPQNTSAAPVVTTSAAAAAPTIDVWYGDHQTFGALGRAQRWVNLLGTVSDPDGVRLLTYRLNGGQARTLRFGPDGRRLQEPGDFNVQIGYDELRAGANDVELRAQDLLGHVAAKTVTVDVPAGTSWPFPYRTDWTAPAAVTGQSQVVDGRWASEGGTVRASPMGYDRLLALGDAGWTNYAVEVPLTIHGIGAPPPGVSGAPLVGLALRWQGHSLKKKETPYIDPNPVGALAWLRWAKTTKFELTGDEGVVKVGAPLRAAVFEVPYVFKARVLDVEGATQYSFKAWPQSQAEPPGWDLEIAEAGAPANGGIALIAHYADVSFGDVTVEGLGQ
jgi:hypothetical protein